MIIPCLKEVGGEALILRFVHIGDVADTRIHAVLPGEDFCDSHSIPQKMKADPCGSALQINVLPACGPGGPFLNEYPPAAGQ